MSHERQDIRDAIVAQLVEAETSAGARVLKTRLEPVRTSQLPCLAVYTEDETVDPSTASTAPRELKRIVRVAITAFTVATENVDDALDDLALEVETAMDVDLNLDETAFDSVLLSTEYDLKMEGERPLGAIRLVYRVVYHTDIRTQEADEAREDLETVDVQYDLEGSQDVLDQAHDLVEDLEE